MDNGEPYPQWEQIQLNIPDEQPLWELFHENSKITRYTTPRDKQAVLAYMQRTADVLDYSAFPQIPLPAPLPLSVEIGSLLMQRASARALQPRTLSLAELSTLLFYTYGVTRDNAEGQYPRPFRIIPSGGAMYPLELYVYSNYIAAQAAGLFHYNPRQHSLERIKTADLRGDLQKVILQDNFAQEAALILMITAIFERSIYKYGERGYRFILLEAGHAAQNFTLTANALELGCVSIGGFHDRGMDALLGIDGVTHSCLYLNVIGEPVASAA